MKDIIIISNYIHFKNELGNSRFIYLAEKINDKESVEIITSTFYHRLKKQRKCISNSSKYKVKLIHEPGYKKNISLARIYSNYIFANNIIKYLKKRKKPDIIYCAIPPTIVGKKIVKFANKNNIKIIIDIQDLWPEAYKMVFNIPLISDILYLPIKLQADYAYKNADNIIAVSETYLNRALKVNKKSKENISVFLGTDLDKFDKYKSNHSYEKDELKIVYLGTLGYSYDIECVIDAIHIINNDKIKFIIIGDGPLKKQFETYAKMKNINCEFTGNLKYEEMVKKISTCDIAVNPIKSKSAGSIINKVGDYAAASLPVINTQECQEYRDLVEKYEVGYNCQNGNAYEIAQKIEFFLQNPKEMKRLGNNNRKLAEEKFNRKVTYNKIIELLK